MGIQQTRGSSPARKGRSEMIISPIKMGIETNWDELSQPNTVVFIKFIKQMKYHKPSYHHIKLYHTSSHWAHIGRCSCRPKWATEIYGSLGVYVRSMHVPGKNLEKVARRRLMVCFQDFSGFRHLIQKGIDMNRVSKSPASCLHPSPYWSKILRDQYCARFFHPKKNKSYHSRRYWYSTLSIHYPYIIHILSIYYPYISHILSIYYPYISHILSIY